MFSPVSIRKLVCQQGYTKTTEQIVTKLGWGMGLARPRIDFIKAIFQHNLRLRVAF